MKKKQAVVLGARKCVRSAPCCRPQANEATTVALSHETLQLEDLKPSRSGYWRNSGCVVTRSKTHST